MPPILQSNPKANYLAHESEIDAAIQRTLKSGWYILGEEVGSFEREFAAFMKTGHCLGVANGTDALSIALRACEIGKGDGVITVSHTAVATVAAIELAGATPILVDINPATFTMDVGQLEQTLERFAKGNLRVKAIIPVHLYGHPANIPAILELAKKFGVRVIEDCAQSHGAMINGKLAGTWGDLAAYSFYPTKNLGALGDGGAVTTNDPALAECVRHLREYGWRERYVSEIPGMNTRLDELQAAILRVKLKYLATENAWRRAVAKIYDAALENFSAMTPRVQSGVEHVFHQYVIRSPKRDELRAFLKAENIGTLVHYPVPVHLQPAYQGRIQLADGGLAETERAAREVLSLPMHPQLSDAEAQRVGEAVARWAGQSPKAK